MDGQKTLRFINDEASSVHGSIRVSSVFTSESGEWKLAGLEVLSSMKEDDAVIYVRNTRPACGHSLMSDRRHTALMYQIQVGTPLPRSPKAAGTASSEAPSLPQMPMIMAFWSPKHSMADCLAPSKLGKPEE